MDISQVVTPKSFFVQERDRFYSSWLASFWRELFQNSVDAGSKTIDITVSMEPGKGSFGRDRVVDEVIRVNFNDDGCGMTQDVLDNVYFRLGESTKREAGGSVGGFGRARLMLAYANVRYSLLTGDRAVEGDGPHYAHQNVAEMAESLAALADRIRQESPDDQRVADLLAGETRLRAIAARGGVKGCHFQVDINPKEYPDRPNANPSVDKLMRTLSEYLKTSQVPCKVIVNGEERKERLLKGPARRTLSATLEDGTEQQFATVHTSQGEKASFKRQVIVRVDGATMFTTHISSDVQVVIELDKALARDVLTSNRDSFREPYAAAFDVLKEELILDVKSALEKDKVKSYTVPGSLGKMRAEKPATIDLKEVGGDGWAPDGADEIRQAAASLPAARPSATAASELEANGFGGVPYHVLLRFFEQTRYSNTFLAEYTLRETRDKVVSATEGRTGVQMVRSAIEALDPDELAYVTGQLLERLAESRRKAQEELDSKLKGMPDIRIATDGDVTGKLLKSMRRNDPKNWDPATGQGLKARGIFAAWTVLVDEAIDTLVRYRPTSVPDDFQWTTGFVYSAPREDYRFNRFHEALVTEAQHQKDEDDTHYLLLNPVDSDGTLRYNPRDPADLHYQAALAAHEVAHIAESWHNEEFAELLTTIVGRMDMRRAAKRVKSALDEIRDIYKEGKVRAQAMDDEAGARPSERLMAGSAPAAFVSAGVMSSPENRHLPSAVRDTLSASITRHEDGTVESDCDAIQTLEHAAVSGYDPEPEAESAFTY